MSQRSVFVSQSLSLSLSLPWSGGLWRCQFTPQSPDRCINPLPAASKPEFSHRSLREWICPPRSWAAALRAGVLPAQTPKSTPSHLQRPRLHSAAWTSLRSAGLRTSQTHQGQSAYRSSFKQSNKWIVNLPSLCMWKNPMIFNISTFHQENVRIKVFWSIIRIIIWF